MLRVRGVLCRFIKTKDKADSSAERQLGKLGISSERAGDKICALAVRKGSPVRNDNEFERKHTT